MTRFFTLLMCVIGVASNAGAQVGGSAVQGYRAEAGAVASAMPAPLREIGFDQHLGDRVPLDDRFVDDEGHAVRLADYFGRRPVVLVFAYYTCPMLCTEVLNGLVRALSVLSLEPGRDFDLVTISIDPSDTAATAHAKKASYVARLDRPGLANAWHFLTGDQAAIDRLTKAAGFRYVWDQQTQQFAHPTGVIVLTPDGELARYLFGIEYGPRDLRFALVEASAGRIGSPADALLLYCYHYDPETGRYGLVVMRAVRLAGAATVLVLGVFIFAMARRDSKGRSS